MIWLNGADIELTGPAAPAPWAIEIKATDHPVDVVDRLVRERIGPPRVLHSTSWRHDGHSLILTFIVVIDPDSVGLMGSAPVPRAELARSDATAAPDEVAREQVLEHALRHLAWLAADDPVVSVALPDEWRTALAPYAPEPFRNLG